MLTLPGLVVVYSPQTFLNTDMAPPHIPHYATYSNSSIPGSSTSSLPTLPSSTSPSPPTPSSSSSLQSSTSSPLLRLIIGSILCVSNTTSCLLRNQLTASNEMASSLQVLWNYVSSITIWCWNHIIFDQLLDSLTSIAGVEEDAVKAWVEEGAITGLQDGAVNVELLDNLREVLLMLLLLLIYLSLWFIETIARWLVLRRAELLASRREVSRLLLKRELSRSRELDKVLDMFEFPSGGFWWCNFDNCFSWAWSSPHSSPDHWALGSTQMQGALYQAWARMRKVIKGNLGFGFPSPRKPGCGWKWQQTINGSTSPLRNNDGSCCSRHRPGCLDSGWDW